MKKHFNLILFLIAAFLVAFSLWSCSLTNTDYDEKDLENNQDIPNEYNDRETKVILLTYKEAQSLGFEGTLQEFLNLVSGEDGKTPTLEIDQEGYWVINGVKTNTKATGSQGERGENGAAGAQGPKGEKGEKGEDGKTPTIEIDENGYWVINGVKSNIKALGTDGQKGEAGSAGADGERGAGIATIQFDDMGNLIITLTDGTVLDPIIVPKAETNTHSFGDWIPYSNNSSAVCTDNLLYAVCSKCNHVEWKLEPGLSHKFTTVTIAPTCVSYGYDEHTCTVCGMIEKNNYKSPSDHSWNTDYSSDSYFHWIECKYCDSIDKKAEHNITEHSCYICGALPTPSNGIQYKLSEDKTYAEVIEYTGDDTRVLISSEYENVPVTVISADAFKDSHITSVTIPDSVTVIENCAFSYCSMLEEVNISNKCIVIGREAFSNCAALMSITIPKSVTDVGAAVFQSCIRLTVYCEGTAEGRGWSSQWNLSNVPVVWDCKNNDVAEDGHIYAVIDGLRYALSGTEAKLVRQAKNITNANIPSSIVYKNKNYNVTSISDSAFYNCKNLVSIVIGDNIINIGSHAFKNCYALTDIYYSLSSERWNMITIGDGIIFDNINIHFDFF